MGTEKLLNGAAVEKCEGHELSESAVSFFKFDHGVAGTMKEECFCDVLLGKTPRNTQFTEATGQQLTQVKWGCHGMGIVPASRCTTSQRSGKSMKGAAGVPSSKERMTGGSAK